MDSLLPTALKLNDKPGNLPAGHVLPSTRHGLMLDIQTVQISCVPLDR
jgi:hypothetical protein